MPLLAVEIRLGQTLVGDVLDVDHKTFHNPVMQQVEAHAPHDPFGAVFVAHAE